MCTICTIDGKTYYAVEVKGRRKVILDLPPSEDPGNYLFELATCEVEAQLHTRYAAVRIDHDVLADEQGWEGQGGKLYA